MASLASVIASLDEMYDPAWAESWDAVGLVCGEPDAEVRRVLFAVDPAREIAAEAVDWGADLVVAHHPLFLRPVHGVPATTPKGRVVHTLLTNGIALHVAHTNADVANPGVSDALARALGLEPIAPLVSAEGDETVPVAARRGLGRVGELPAPEPLRDFVTRVVDGLPATAQGVVVAGELDRPVQTIAVAGGAGDKHFEDAVNAGADVYLTADLRHHPAAEALDHGNLALINVSHWASEWPWLPDAAAMLSERLGDTVEIRISRITTDPWTAHIRTTWEQR